MCILPKESLRRSQNRRLATAILATAFSVRHSYHQSSAVPDVSLWLRHIPSLHEGSSPAISSNESAHTCKLYASRALLKVECDPSFGTCPSYCHSCARFWQASNYEICQVQLSLEHSLRTICNVAFAVIFCLRV
jgi:hypothetical protein